MKHLLNYFIATAICLIGLVGCTNQEQVQSPNLLKLWYTQPANQWEEALPLGNGRMGAMVFGGANKDIIQLNEESVWAGEPGNNLPVGFKEVLPKSRELLLGEKYQEAHDLLLSKFPRHAGEGNNYGMPYQTVGELVLEFKGHDEVTDYYRELDISNATSSVRYNINGVQYTREYLASTPDNVIAIKLA